MCTKAVSQPESSDGWQPRTRVVTETTTARWKAAMTDNVPLIPRQPVPPLTLPLVGGGS